MTYRRPAVLTAACILALLTLPAASSRADAPALHGSTLRHYHHRIRRTAVPSLPSRGGSETVATPPVVGRVAVVVTDNAPIRGGRERAGRILSLCPKGQYLAISAETPADYAVVMIDHTYGFIAKNDVQLLNLQAVANPAPSGDNAGDAAPPSPGVDGAGRSLGQRLVQTAESYLGVPYVWGGNTSDGIDCSGFVKAVYASFGIDLPRHSGDQAMVGYDVPRSDWTQWVPGDRMYFACHHPEIDHTAMYIGGGYFIHASVGHGREVAIDRVDNAYYARHLVAVRRSKELLGEAPTPGALVTASSATAVGTVLSDPEASQQ